MGYGIKLRAAAIRGDLRQVTKLLERGADVNDADAGWTALIYAAREGHVAVVEALLARGANVNSPNKYGNNALPLAAMYGHVLVVESLLARGAPINGTSQYGNTALHWAAHYGHVAAVEALHARGAAINHRGQLGRTALQMAAHKGHVAVVETLLARGAEVNGADEEDGDAALHLAAKKGHMAVTETLLARGAAINHRGQLGRTALQMAAHQGHVAVVETLLARGAEVNFADEERGDTALHLAAVNGHMAVMETLLVGGAHVGRANNMGDTPIHYAAGKNNQSVALALWRAGADPLKQNYAGKTPLLLLPQNSYAAKQMRAGLFKQPAQPTPSTARAAADHHRESPALNQLQKVWVHTKTSAITPQQLLDALKAEHVTSFSDLVLAHHMLLLAVRQRVLTRSQLASFGGSRDYLLENVYLPITKCELTDEQKFWLSGLLTYAERKRIIRDGNATLVKIVADLRSEIRQTSLEMHSALVSVAREINSLQQRVGNLEQWATQAAESFQHLCQGQQQMLSDMKNMAASLQQLHRLLKKQQRRRTRAGVLDFCLAMIPVVGGVLASTSSAAKAISDGFNLDQISSLGTIAVNEILAVDISNFQTVSVLMSDRYLNNLDLDVRQRVEAVVEQTDFETLPNLQQRLTVVVEELKDSDEFSDLEEEEEDAEVRERFVVLASRSHSDDQTVTAQDAMPELQHILQLHLSEAGEGVTVDDGDVEDVVLDQMDDNSCLLDMDAFIKSFRELCKKYPTVKRQREPPELRERFQNATRSKNVLKIKLAKRLLHALFSESGSEAHPARAPLSFRRSREEWHESEVDALLPEYGPGENVIDEEGFVKVGMKMLFA